MKYYAVAVMHIVEAEDEASAQQKAFSGTSIHKFTLEVKDVSDKMAEIIHRMTHPRPEKGLW